MKSKLHHWWCRLWKHSCIWFVWMSAPRPWNNDKWEKTSYSFAHSRQIVRLFTTFIPWRCCCYFKFCYCCRRRCRRRSFCLNSNFALFCVIQLEPVISRHKTSMSHFIFMCIMCTYFARCFLFSLTRQTI